MGWRWIWQLTGGNDKKLTVPLKVDTNFDFK